MILTFWCTEIQSSLAAMNQLQLEPEKSRTSAPPSIKTVACYPGDCPVRPQSPGIPSYTHASMLLVGCPPLMHCLDGKGAMRCHFVACTQQQLRFQLNPYHRPWPFCQGIRQ